MARGAVGGVGGASFTGVVALQAAVEDRVHVVAVWADSETGTGGLEQ